MNEANRSLSACLRCRKQKLKCGGPHRVPCDRCRANRAECVFVAPRAAHVKAASPTAQDDGRLTRLEQRLSSMEGELRGEIRELQAAVERLSADPKTNPKADSKAAPKAIQKTARSSDNSRSRPQASKPSEIAPQPEQDIVARGIVTETEWNDLYQKHCRDVISIVDDQIYPPISDIRRHPLLSTAICTIAARALFPERYRYFVDEGDVLISKTFQGLDVDLLSFYAIMLLTAWTGRARLWGYAASVAYDMQLHLAALQFRDEAADSAESVVERARAWFTLCGFDLIINLNRPFAINRMQEYLPHAKKLVTSPYCRPVDHRICAYIDGFIITGDAKARLQSSHLQANPLPDFVSKLLTSYDQQVDAWFHRINSSIDPVFQTFEKTQDRNRFIIPYTLVKLYINGLALHGVELIEGDPDPGRLGFVKTALASACLLLQTQWESRSFRRAFRYTIDYNGTTTFHASRFILKVMQVLPQQVDEASYVALGQAAKIFELAGATDVAEELRREIEKFTTVITPLEPSPETAADSLPESIFDILNMPDRTTWDNDFPMINTYTLE